MAGPTSAPANAELAASSGGERTMPPRMELVVTETCAVWLSCKEQRVPLVGGTAAAVVRFQSAPNSRVTPLEPSPGKVAPGASEESASGEYPTAFQLALLPEETVTLSRKEAGNIPYPCDAAVLKPTK